jgi:hypothetical protein
MKISDYFYTRGQTAKILGITCVTVWRWVKEGKFNDVQYIGNETLIPKWEVDLLKEKKGTKNKTKDIKSHKNKGML